MAPVLLLHGNKIMRGLYHRAAELFNRTPAPKGILFALLAASVIHN
ncbi:MAG: hypothetical protein JXK51_05765 [Halothiobacillaceae bacterium]|jgi:hypothetical protein|nr:hypothetical protein [Halothiobacillaceae bacterium]HQS03214.1 hypothetical protein [Halothiobacillus sp.]HQS29988.1 hypothetical protein [Halothiobacillus sp.]HUM99014.1 hypothetical protein [Halothiobacillus sp.]